MSTTSSRPRHSAHDLHAALQALAAFPARDALDPDLQAVIDVVLAAARMTAPRPAVQPSPERSSLVSPPRQRSPKPWKAVRHHPGDDPAQHAVWVYSAGRTEKAARHVLRRVEAAFNRAHDQIENERWAWAIIYDPHGRTHNPSQ